MEGGSLFNPGFLGGSFLWWVGQIADDSTWRDNILPGKFENKETIPGWGRRYKVRIIGLHDKEEESIPSNQLPWAQVMYPVTGGGGQAAAGQTANLRQGMFVFGFFLDGQDQQVPVIMGVLGNNAQTALNTKFENFGPTSGFVEGEKPKTGSAKEKVPDEGLVVAKPKSQEQSKECAPAPPGVQTNSFGLRADIPLNRQQFADAQSARAEAESQGLTGQERDNFVQQRVADGIKNRCSQSNSPGSPTNPGATKENVDAVHELSVADVKRDEKYQEKIVLLKPDNPVQSAINAIQTVLDNLTQKIYKYLNALQSYIDAVSSVIDDIQSIIANAACEIAKYVKILFDKIMEYVLKILNKSLTDVVSAMPSSMRYMFADIKEILTELILCLYNKITQNLCGLIQGLLDDALNIEEAEAQARERALNPQSDFIYSPSVPVCYAEDVVGEVISYNKEEIDTANNSIVDNLNVFLDDVQSELAGVSGTIADITSLVGDINGSITSALNFENLRLNIFGCEITPNVAVSDYYTFGSGGEGQPDSQLPSAKSIENAANKPSSARFVPDVPFAEPSKNQADVNLRSDASSPEQISQRVSGIA